ncbi:MAG TPA: high-potential iron-sulfur protein [Burkholderiaceae bacterium]|nr:high-potential iron-sulfur protein [Burkholderiaceae bacterium]
MSTRRTFIAVTPLAMAALWMRSESLAAAEPLLEESDPTARSLGYVSDATRTDRAKYPQWAPGQACRSCQLFQGRPGAPQGACPIYAGKLVLATGWCSAYVKKV